MSWRDFLTAFGRVLGLVPEQVLQSNPNNPLMASLPYLLATYPEIFTDTTVEIDVKCFKAILGMHTIICIICIVFCIAY